MRWLYRITAGISTRGIILPSLIARLHLCHIQYVTKAEEESGTTVIESFSTHIRVIETAETYEQGHGSFGL